MMTYDYAFLVRALFRSSNSDGAFTSDSWIGIWGNFFGIMAFDMPLSWSRNGISIDGQVLFGSCSS